MCALRYAGFSIGSLDWLASDLVDAHTASEREGRLALIGQEEARLTAGLGGNLLRVFFSPATLLGSQDAAFSPWGGDSLPPPPDAMAQRFHQLPFYMLTLEEQVGYLELAHGALRRQRARVDAAGPDGEGLNFADLDAYLKGVAAFDAAAGSDRPVRVLLTRVQAPPRPLIECPSHAVLSWHGARFRFHEMWECYNAIHAGVAERLAFRYLRSRPWGGSICGFEINNEPDYEWLPEELRIEKSPRPEASPVGKYVTELHVGQVPQNADPNPPHQPTPWGGFEDQQGAWHDYGMHPAPTTIHDHDFGVKFRWYVRCYVDTAKHVGAAFWNATRGTDVKVVSAGVTHVNLHYLMAMYRADPEAFAAVDAIGLHPYHWPGNDIHNAAFWTERSYADWPNATPRGFAAGYFKHFDFLREAHRLTTISGPAGYGLTDKTLWLTEFGLPTKRRGLYNEPQARFMPFIHMHGDDPDLPVEGYGSVTWEGLWDAFLTSVKPERLAAHGVEALAIYTLRETAGPGFDKHDDDRSNFSLLRRNGKPRLEPATFDRLRGLFRKAAANRHASAPPRAPGQDGFRVIPRWGRAKSFSSTLLRSRPWLAARPPAAVRDCLSMMSEEEKKLLFWAGSEYFTDAGEVVDAGCFVGGSTVALAEGLRDSWPDTERRVRTYDLFRTDSFMDAHYFKPNGLTLEGDRFRNVFDANTAGVAGLVETHEGDITQRAWDRGPIEVLFIDICKAWAVDDHVTATFFPHLIPGQSLVLQQDFFHHWCPWLAITMELLHDSFEYLAMAKWNTAVFRCIAPVDVSIRPARLREQPFDTLHGLMRRQIERHDDVYRRGVLLGAMMALCGEFNEKERYHAAREELESVAGDHGELAAVQAQLRETFAAAMA